MNWNEAISVLSRLYDTSHAQNQTTALNLLAKAKLECGRRGILYGGNGENCMISMIENPETFHNMSALDFLNYHFTPYGDSCYTGPMAIDPHMCSHADYVAALNADDIHICLGMWVRDWGLVTNSRYFWYRLLGDMVEYDTNSRRCALARHALGDMYLCLVHKLNPTTLLSELKTHQGYHAPASPTRTPSVCSGFGSGSSATNSDPDAEYQGELQFIDGRPGDFEDVEATSWDGGYSADEIDDSERELVATITERVMNTLLDPTSQ
ncbi:hypothetical protein T484DRAFT_1758541 [Baffinella frigidus]|nr:hypothetical protein T484DRAFT_1758541 [Cryptophyta sp. CCMP2293]